MTYLQPSIQVILFLVFAIGGTIRFFQPIDVLAKRMRWVSYFNPRIVRSISLVEVICGIGFILPFFFAGPSFSILLYSGCLLIATMIGAVITHFVIGDYKEIFGNVCLIGMIYYAAIPTGQIDLLHFLLFSTLYPFLSEISLFLIFHPLRLAK